MAVNTEIGFTTTTKLLIALVKLKQSDARTLALYAGCHTDHAVRTANALVKEGLAISSRKPANSPQGGGFTNVYSITNAGIIVINNLYQTLSSVLKLDRKSHITSTTSDFVRVSKAS